MIIDYNRVNLAANALSERITERVDKGGFIDYPYLAWLVNKLKAEGIVDPCLEHSLDKIENPFDKAVYAKDYLGERTFTDIVRRPLGVWNRCIFDYLGIATFTIVYHLFGQHITEWYCNSFNLDPNLMRGFNRDEYLETINLAWVGSILGKPQ